MVTAVYVVAGLAVCAGVVLLVLWHCSSPTRSVTQILAELETVRKR